MKQPHPCFVQMPQCKSKNLHWGKNYNEIRVIMFTLGCNTRALRDIPWAINNVSDT